MSEIVKGVERDEIIKLVDLRKEFDDGFVAVDNVNLYVRRGEFITFLGPSGHDQRKSQTEW